MPATAELGPLQRLCRGNCSPLPQDRLQGCGKGGAQEGRAPRVPWTGRPLGTPHYCYIRFAYSPEDRCSTEYGSVRSRRISSPEQFKVWEPEMYVMLSVDPSCPLLGPHDQPALVTTRHFVIAFSSVVKNMIRNHKQLNSRAVYFHLFIIRSTL